MRTLLGSLAVAAAVAVGGCEGDLTDALDEVRSAAPEVCKDFCEDMITCEWAIAKGDLEDDAFSAQIRRCTVDCAWYMTEGAYVVTADSLGQKEYVDRVSGPSLREALDCAFYAGAYRCSDVGGHDAHLFAPPVESICNLTGACMQKLDIDYGMTWNEAAATCDVTGSETVESIFF